MTERSKFPEAVRTMSVDAKMLMTVAIMIFTAGGVYAVLQGSVHANTSDVSRVSAEVHELEETVDELEDQVHDNGDAITDQARGLNWIGEAIQAIAEKQDVSLPPRPIVAE